MAWVALGLYVLGIPVSATLCFCVWLVNPAGLNDHRATPPPWVFFFLGVAWPLIGVMCWVLLSPLTERIRRGAESAG